MQSWSLSYFCNVENYSFNTKVYYVNYSTNKNWEVNIFPSPQAYLIKSCLTSFYNLNSYSSEAQRYLPSLTIIKYQ